MDYTSNLVELLSLQDLVPVLNNGFSQFYRSQKELKPVIDKLRRIKAFIHDGKCVYKPILEDTLVDSTDCLTLAVIGNILAEHQGVETQIAHPRGIRFLHSVLAYKDSQDQGRIFKLTGRKREYSINDCTILTPEEVVFRLKYFKPFVNFANSLKPRPGKLKHYYSVFCEGCKANSDRQTQ